MKCPDCGRELILMRELTDEEQKDFEYFTTKESNARQIIYNNPVIDELTKEELSTYYKVAFDQMAEAQFLRQMFFREIAKEMQDANLQGSPYVIDGGLYIHPINNGSVENGNA